MPQPLAAQRIAAERSPARSRHSEPVTVTRLMPSTENLLQRREGSCACGGGCPHCQEGSRLQARLTVNEPDDVYEQEADRVAEQVMRMPAPSLQRSCASCAAGGSTRPKCEAVKEGLVQRKTKRVSSGSGFVADSFVHDLGPGQPLDWATRAFFEPRLGQDLGRVQVHADAKAAESADAVNALAYTVGTNVVFGAGQYAPESAAGRKLLAHELAHTVQQSQVSSSSAEQVSLVQRQAQPGAATQPAAGTGWQGCDADRIGQLNSELADAVSWVDEAITDLQTAPLPAHTHGALGRYLSTDPADITGSIIPALQDMLTELQGGPANFQCQSQAQCDAIPCPVPTPGLAACSTHPITLCDNYFTIWAFLLGGSSVRTGTLIHEVGHHAGLGGDTYEFTWPFPGLSVTDRLQNADSFVAFVVTNHYSWLPPVTGPAGLSFTAGAGALFQQGVAEPRFIVTAELQAPLARRVFHFFDLRAGTRVDVDMSGSVILSESLGARLFTPTSVSSIPWYLDLSGGFSSTVAGPALIGGPAAEVRTGILPGHFGASIGYRHIWNVMRANSDIDELTISGEIHF